MPCAFGPGEEIKLVGDEGKGRNLYQFSRGRWVNVTRFGRPHHIFDYGVSPEGRYLFAWHMDFSPRRVSVYDLHRGGQRIGRFEPGFGGSFCWNSRNHIVHLFGCGSGCQGCKVYDLRGCALPQSSLIDGQLAVHTRFGLVRMPLDEGAFDWRTTGPPSSRVPIARAPPLTMPSSLLYQDRDQKGRSGATGSSCQCTLDVETTSPEPGRGFKEQSW